MNRGAGPSAGESVAVRYTRVISVVVVLIVAVWHFGYDSLILVRGWSRYEPAWAALASWLVLSAVQLVGSVLLLRGALRGPPAPLLTCVALLAGVMAVAAYPRGGAISDLSWAANTVGWFGVLLLAQRPMRELVALLACTVALTTVALGAHGELGTGEAWARLIAQSYTTAGIQLAFVLLSRELHHAARLTADAARAQADRMARRAAGEALHAERRRRYRYLRDRIAPLLRELAEGRAHPGDEGVRRASAIEAARLRRLFAETEDADHPLLHELRACADVAERRDVDVTFVCYGELPDLPVAVRRRLTDGPILALASARNTARVTVVVTAGEVTVGVVADASADAVPRAVRSAGTSVLFDEKENLLWLESRWRLPVPRSTSASSTTTRW
ncbi:hypothetical protein KVH02_20165 [Streptomyces olivaceus]|uniref:Histidine kinase n=1 Tax=Streptomyces olivaceus TaxID=47716 RepID=A0ABS7W4T2_STROV|nr:hypothetical protein [Streptomyces olivaceus]MBZ6081964.1 hypothetical protein [Streptomyces olivaceus]MBZ6090622.1 hypothetical protein [Streptomyces olivaceus]MBZ6096798.1 hypothetical protein [Streptomyces olivaceus]MBZ6117552.1 hypothetical protein [Streptomyces olivaceus]MBZ6152962.1 hypothetical protein [Streptomyces olivaceus]